MQKALTERKEKASAAQEEEGQILCLPLVHPRSAQMWVRLCRGCV